MSTLREKLTYANVMASLAVFLALTSAGYAAGRIHGSQLKKRSVAGVKLKRNTVTGREIRESRLSTVPRARRARSARSARTADTAATADTAGAASNADTLDGLDSSQLKVSCAAGLLYEAGACFEPTTRTAQVYRLAVATCAVDGRRLPTHNELQALLGRPDVSAAADGELTSSVAESRSTPGQLDVVVVTDDTGNASFVPAGGTSSPRAFRCVEPRAN